MEQSSWGCKLMTATQYFCKTLYVVITQQTTHRNKEIIGSEDTEWMDTKALDPSETLV